MKAYQVDLYNDPDAGSEIIFAKNTKDARKLAHDTDLARENDHDFIDVKVMREPAFDNMENATDEEMLIKKWHEGWWFGDVSYPPKPGEISNAKFLEWLKGVH